MTRITFVALGTFLALASGLAGSHAETAAKQRKRVVAKPQPTASASQTKSSGTTAGWGGYTAPPSSGNAFDRNGY